MTSSPKITLITVVRNGARFIERCLQSVAAQKYDNLEYIVLDGASTDGTQEIIGRYLSLISTFASRPDKDANDAVEQAYAMAKGDIVGLVHADDWLEDGALAALAELYRQQPDAEMFCFAMQEHRMSNGGSSQKSVVYSDPPGSIFTLQDGLYCQGVNRFYARSIFTKEPVYRMEPYPNLSDRYFYVRLGLHGVKKAWTDKILYNFLVHPGSNTTGGTAEKVALFLDETARMAEDVMKRPELSRQQQRVLQDWYCFNSIRSVWFTLKAGSAAGALGKAARLVVRYPLRTLRNLLYWKMPTPYRARASYDR